MTEKVAELLKRALELPPEGRAALASSLLASIDDDDVDDGAELEWEREIARRVDELKAGTVTTIPWAEVRQRALIRVHNLTLLSIGMPRIASRQPTIL